jgi:hypothetical protein
LSRATASAILPTARSMLALPGISVTVNADRSRTVTTALPPRSIRAIERSPVVTVTLPSSVVTTPALGDSAQTRDGEITRTGSARMSAA